MSTSKGVAAATSVFAVLLAAIADTRAGEPGELFALRGSETAENANLQSVLNQHSSWALRDRHENLLLSSLVNRVTAPEFRDPASGTPDLADFLRDSINNNDLLKASVFEANAVHNTARETRFGLLPSITLDANITHQNQNNLFPGSNIRDTNAQGSITANWTIFSQQASWSNVRAASLDALAADLDYLGTERQIFLQNSMIYTALHAGRKSVAAIRTTLTRLQRIRESISRQFKAGFASRSDIAQVDAEIGSVRAQLQAALSTVKQQEAAYRDAVGKTPPKNLATLAIVSVVPKSLDATLSRALHDNFTIDAAETRKHAEEARSKASRNQFLPTVGLFAQLSSDTNQVASLDNDMDITVGVNIAAPLVDFRLKPRHDRTRQLALAAKYRAQDTHRQIGLAVETSWIAMQSAKKQREALRKRQKAIYRSIEGIRAQVDAGLLPISDLLREEIELTNNSISIADLNMEINNNAFAIAAQFSDLSLDELL